MISGACATNLLAAAPPRPSLAELFVAFAMISLSGFGGVLAWSRRMMVEERSGSPPSSSMKLTRCARSSRAQHPQFLRRFRSRVRGPLGGLVALAGLMGPPMTLVLIIAAVYAHYGDLPALRRALIGVAAAAAGLMMSTVAKMALPLFHNRAVRGPLIALATFVAIGILQWPLPLVLVVIVPVSIAVARVRR